MVKFVPPRWKKSRTGMMAFEKYIITYKTKLLDSYEECTIQRNVCNQQCKECNFSTDINKIWNEIYGLKRNKRSSRKEKSL